MPDIDILIKATDQASAPIKKVEAEMKGLGTSAKTTSTGLSGLGNVLKAGLTTALVGTAAAMAGLGVFLTQSLGQARAQIEADKQLEQVIKSTGGAAGVTAKQAQDLATSLMNVTNFGDDAIESGQSLLLTFTGIGKDVFPRATETMLDMSQALGQDLKSSAIQLGKALNDPVQGITALSRVGVSFTDQQKEMIKTMVEAGDTAGAQGVILNELGKEFGGSAKAMADPVKQLQNAWGEFEESMGMALVPLLNNLAQTVLPTVQAATQVLTDTLKNGFVVFEDGSGTVMDFLTALGMSKDAAQGFGQNFYDLRQSLEGTFNSIKGTFQTDMGWIKLAWETDWGDIHTTWTTFATDLPNEQARFWDEWHKTFDAGSQANVNDWEGYLGGLGTFAAGWWRLTAENWTVSLALLRGEWQAFSALFKGDWEGTWNGFKLALFSVTDIMLNYIEFSFGPGLRDKMAGALNSMWDTMKGIFANIQSWWQSSLDALRNLNPFSGGNGEPSGGATVPSNFAIVNPQNTGNNTATIQSVGGISVTQHFYGQTDPPAIQNASKDGVLDAARKLGIK